MAAVPQIEGLTVEDMLDFARAKPAALRLLPDERDWDHMDRKWLCDIRFTVDKANFEKKVKDAVKAAGQQLALREHGPGVATHTRIGQQVGRCGEQVGDDQLLDLLAAKMAALQNLASKTRAQKAGSAGDQDARDGIIFNSTKGPGKNIVLFKNYGVLKPKDEYSNTADGFKQFKKENPLKDKRENPIETEMNVL
jgi:hypothetical protein